MRGVTFLMLTIPSCRLRPLISTQLAKKAKKAATEEVCKVQHFSSCNNLSLEIPISLSQPSPGYVVDMGKRNEMSI